MSQKGYLTISEVADLCRVSRSAVRRWCEQGIGPKFSRTAGGHRRFERRDVLAWIKTLEVGQR